MRITDLLRPEGISLGAAPKDKDGALDALVKLQQTCGNLSDPKAYKADLLAREAQGSTAIGDGIAVPHAKSAAVQRPGLAAITVPGGVDYGAPDGKPSNLFFAIAAPAEGGDTHLEILSRLMVLLMDADFRSKLLSAKDPAAFLAAIDAAEREKYPDEATEEAAPVPKKEGYRLLAVTACPTGIAHTYMAAEALEKKGAELGHKIYKHLMNGVSHMLPFVIGGGILIALAFLFDAGAVNDTNFGDFGTITPIAAFLKSVGGAAFGFMLPILAGFIAESIADRPGLAVGFVGGALAVSGATFASPTGTDVSAGFLGALIAGFAGGYLTLGLEKLCDKLPRALEGIKPILIYPLVGVFAIGVVMCAINPFVGMINTAVYGGLESLNGASAILLGAVVAGMMAIDMGGPFNKAAYLFGTASLVNAAGQAVNSPTMAAVMVGGMVPPIAIALACTFFKNRFTADERKNGYVNYIMGLCFITEGAIPFAAADPIRVIPSCVVGSAVAGALSMAFGCTLPAPHGGLFVFPVMGNVLMYVVALAAGSVVGMAMLALLKKKKV